jgi:hypothetical protein
MSYNSPFTGQVIQPTDVSYRAVTLTANTQLQWPINGNATDDYAARIMQVTASTAGLSLFMPPANQTSVGNDALIRNVGANTFTVKDYAGTNTIVSIAAGETKYIYVTTNANDQGTWGIIAFGTGTSSADAATLAGFGLLASGATLNQSHPAASLIAGYTFLASDRAQTYVWGGGTTTVTLPSAADVGNNWFTLVKNNGTGTLTINTTNSQEIDNALTKSFAPNESAFIISTGVEYVTVGYGTSTQFAFTALVKSVVSGAYTLTASEASNTIQTYIGTLTGNVTVTYPPVVNLYVVSNQTTAGGNSLTLTTGVSGGANAVIPAGGQATLICDGTNFFNANTSQAGATSLSLVNGTAGAPSLNFAAETNTGLYRPGAGRLGITVLGSLIVDVDAGGAQVTGDLDTTGAVNATGAGKFIGGVSGGTFS